MKNQENSNDNDQVILEEPSTQSESEAETAENHEIAGPKGPEPTRFGDWERKGRCIDF